MAEYTVELKTIVENGIPIFDFNYPFYDETKRAEFERNFIRHFYFREIGCETVDRFKCYLADKMNVVFPFYNELFKTALIEYDKLYNYDMTETYSKNAESNTKGGGVSSTVGRMTDEQKTETDENRTVDTVGNVDTVGSDTDKETGKSTTSSVGMSTTNKSETVNNDTTSSSTVEGNASKTTEGSTSTENQNVKKYLDTPQGLTDLTDSKYLTNLTQDNANGEQVSEGKETTTDKQTTTGSGSSDTTTEGSTETNTTDNSTTDTERNATKNTLLNTDTTGKETTASKVSTVSNGEQVSSQDNNTRHYATGESSETYTLTRKGNIGVQTGSDMIEKHIELQKKLSKIEKMFFDECEDLFMLVY